MTDRGTPPPPDEREIERRQRLLAWSRGEEEAPAAKRARFQQALQERAAGIQRQREREAQERERERPQLTNLFDPGPEKASWRREGERSAPAEESSSSQTVISGAATNAVAETSRRHRPRGPRRTRRPWKAPRHKRLSSSETVLVFARDRGWTEERSQRLATRTKRNDAIIAHPSSAEAALKRLGLWSQAAARRALRAMGWTLADQAARRHIALWATMEEWARPRAYSRPRQLKHASGATRFAGIPKFGLAVLGWCQSALAIALSGPDTTCGGADPIDVKTVQRHMQLAQQYGAVQVVVRNPDAPPELRGLPCPSHPRGWPINEYWIPAAGFHKPGFVGAWFAENGSPVELDESLALELVPRAKRLRRLREKRVHEREQQQPPPPLIA